jgi:ABC-type glycerol-3-phosphate transport system substrate-binding protein
MASSTYNRREVLRLAGVSAAGAVIVSRIGARPAAAATELTFLVFETPNLNAEFWDTNIKKIAGGIPGLTIKKLVSPSIDRTAYAKQLLAAGQFPDIGAALAPQEFVQAGALLPYDPAKLDMLTFPEYGAIGGKQYQVPIGGQAIPLLYYNKTQFDKAGVTDEPKTWADFLAACEALKGAGFVPLLHGGGKDPWSSSFMMVGIISADVLGKDKDWVQKRKKDEVHFTDPLFAGAVTKFKALVDASYFNEGGLGIDYAALQDTFIQGQGAIYPMGSWFVGAEASADKDFEVGVFQVPTDSGDQVVPIHPGGGLVVSAKTKAPDLAQEFAIDFSVDKGVVDAFVKADGIFPSIKGYVAPDWVSPLYKQSIELYQTLPPVFAFAWEQGDQASIPGMPDEYHKLAQAIILGGEVEAELKKLDDKWDELAARGS